MTITASISGGPTASLDTRGPIKIASPNDPRLNAPSGITWVTWKPEWTTAKYTLNYVHDNLLNDSQGLLLPEREEPYAIDLSRGFQASGVTSVNGWPQFFTNPRTWFAATRMRRGLMGMGPGTKLQVINPGNWQAPQQPERAVSTDPDPWFYVRSSDGAQVPFGSAAMSVIQCALPGAYAGNFTVLSSPYLGGIAFSFIAFSGSNGHVTCRNIRAKGAWHGFKASPPGETAFVSVYRATYDIANLWLDPIHPTDSRIRGSSPIMINRSAGGTIANVYTAGAVKGMVTLWASRGTHNLVDCELINEEGHGINLECPDGPFTVNVTRGSIIHPGSKMHVGIGSYIASGGTTAYPVVLNVTDCNWDRTYNYRALFNSKPDIFCIQVYGPTSQSVQRKDGTGITVKNGGVTQQLFIAGGI